MKIFKNLYFYVVVAIIAGIILGIYYPKAAVSLKSLSDVFIKLIKMMIIPIIFCTIVTGIAGMPSGRRAGKVGLKAIIYFEVVTTLALIIGIIIINIIKPGANMHINPQTLDTSGVKDYVNSTSKSFTDFILHLIPDNFFASLSEGNIIQVLLFAILFGFGLSAIKEKAQPAVRALSAIADALFVVMKFIMLLAPFGALGAMAFTIGKYGIHSLTSLGLLLICFYSTCLLFIFLILGLIFRLFGFNIFRLLSYISHELLIVLGTSSSESALPSLMSKLKRAGCSGPLVDLVVPTGYSFNLDGTSIYLTMAALFITQAIDQPLNVWQQISLLVILLITSKGAAGVTGAGFITLAATLPAVEHIPVASVAIILGIDRFMSEARAITNIIGNAVATIVIAKWDKQIDIETAQTYIG